MYFSIMNDVFGPVLFFEHHKTTAQSLSIFSFSDPPGVATFYTLSLTLALNNRTVAELEVPDYS